VRRTSLIFLHVHVSVRQIALKWIERIFVVYLLSGMRGLQFLTPKLEQRRNCKYLWRVNNSATWNWKTGTARILGSKISWIFGSETPGGLKDNIDPNCV